MQINQNKYTVNNKNLSKQPQINFTGQSALPKSGLVNNLADKASKLPNKLMNHLDFSGYNMPLSVLAFFTFGIVLGARLLQARDENERREVVTRDFSAISTILLAIPVLNKVCATLSKKITGFPIASGSTKFFDHLRPVLGLQPATYGKLEHWYMLSKNSPKKLVDFCEQKINNQGDLRKIFHLLSNDSKKALNTLTSTFSKDANEKFVPGKGFSVISRLFKEKGVKNIDLIAPKSNEEIINVIKKAYETASDNQIVKKALSTIETELSGKNNLHRFAEFLKSVPGGMNIAITAGFLGWFLPWFNIQYTKQKVLSQHNQMPQNNSVQQQMPQILFQAQQQKNQIGQEFKAHLSPEQQSVYAKFMME